MSDLTIPGLESLDYPATEDLLVSVDDPGGTPVTKKLTLANLITLLAPSLASGADKQIQFKYGDVAGEDSDFTWAKATNTLGLGGDRCCFMPFGVTNEPSDPASGKIRLYSRAVAGRMFPKWKGPSGLDTCFQPALFQNRVLLYVPSTGATGTGSGTGLGPVWTAGSGALTISHPTPSSTAPAVSNQMRRTQFANSGTGTNINMGIKAAAADTLNYLIGNLTDGRGGFFYAARFIVQLIPASTVRIFAGLTASSATFVTASDTVLNNTCGLWHDTTDPLTGAGAFSFVTRAATTSKTAITLANAIAAGNSYDFYMFCAPGVGKLYWRLDDIVNGVTYSGEKTASLPALNAFMGPQCSMSNGTANTTSGTSAFGVAGVYTESDR